MTFAKRWRQMAFAALVFVCSSYAARADVTYHFVTTSYSGLVGTNNGIPYNGSDFTGLPLALVFTDAGVASGEVSGFEQNDFPTADVTGLGGFVSLTIDTPIYTDSATVGTLAGSLALDVTFGPAGQIRSDSIQYTNADISFDLENGSVTVSSDGALGCLALPASNACTAKGYFTVPEPSAISLLLAPLLGFAAVRRDAANRKAARAGASGLSPVAGPKPEFIMPTFNLIGWVRALIIACAIVTTAHAQVPSTSLPSNLVARPLPLTASDPMGLKMHKAVLLMRHGVRPPTSTSKFQAYAAGTFPSNGPGGWNAPDGNLTPEGAVLVQAFGSIERSLYAAKGIVSASGCPRPNEEFVWADNADERTQATATALLAGLYNGCSFSHYYSTSSAADPLFSAPVSLPNPVAAIQAVYAHMGANSTGNFTAVKSYAASLLNQMQNVLNCCSTALCTSNGLSSGCTFPQLPWSVTSSSGSLSLNGPLGTGSSTAQIFELEYENGFKGSNLGFGLMAEPNVQELEQLYTLKYDLFDRSPVLAQQNGSMIAQQMLNAVLQAIPGQTVPASTGAPPNASLTVFVGHDSTQAALGGLLNLHWSFPTYPADDMPAGGTLGFEILSDASATYYVRPIYLVMTLDAMHAGQPTVNYKAPTYQAVQLPGCSLDDMRLCTVPDFVALMQKTIVSSYTVRETYQ
jgi:4-phytase/acid phosphatase